MLEFYANNSSYVRVLYVRRETSGTMKLFQTCCRIIVKLNEAHLTPLNVSSNNTGPFWIKSLTRFKWSGVLILLARSKSRETSVQGVPGEGHEHGKASQKWMHVYSKEGWFPFKQGGKFQWFHDSHGLFSGSVHLLSTKNTSRKICFIKFIHIH